MQSRYFCCSLFACDCTDVPMHLPIAKSRYKIRHWTNCREQSFVPFHLLEGKGTPGERELLVKENCWWKRIAGERELLVKENCWWKRIAGERVLLVKGYCWWKGIAGERVLLVKGNCWWKGIAGERELLVKGNCWWKEIHDERQWKGQGIIFRSCYQKEKRAASVLLLLLTLCFMNFILR